jgi:endonuclease/exonuclease/phosphatase family metal-dependent hydrolase
MNLRVISFNIHKGYNLLKRRYSLSVVRELLETYNPDLVLLQELHGLHPKAHLGEKSPLEELADKHWPFYSFGVNSVYGSGFHGNAIISRYPIKTWNNLDLSTNPLERRGLLHAQVDLQMAPPLHVLCTHLNLTPPGQYRQAQIIMENVQSFDEDARVILGGDFNDWSGGVGRRIIKDSRFQRIERMRSFPSYFPLLCLDGFFYRGLEVLKSNLIKDFSHSSDHLPILVDCLFPV